MASSAKDIQFRELKDTISQLNTTIRTQNDLILSLQQMLEERNARDNEKDRIIVNLQAQLEYFKQKLFGSSSEKRNDLPGQLNLFSEIVAEEEPAPELIEPEFIELNTGKKKRKPKASYDEMFANLPVCRVEVDTLTEEQKHCPVCQNRMVPIGHEEIRTEIRYTRAKLERVVYIATTYGCPVCKETEEPQFIKDEGAPALIPGSYASSSLVSHIMYEKYADALPLYRQEKGFELLGASISRTTMAGWIITCAQDYLQPVYDYFHSQLLERHFLMADETPIQVLKEPDRRPQSKSYVWLIRSGEDRLPPIILYHYTETRAGGNAASFLEGIEDGTYVMVDGYSSYNKLKKIRRCCCYAHIRRYLIEAIPNGHDKDYSHPAVQGVLYCNKLFEYERSYKAKGLSYTQVHKRRLKDEKPVVEGFIRWLDAQRPEKGSRMDRAVTYIRNRKDTLMTYLEDGRCSLSNNPSENSIRPVTLGRKNWLFSDSQAGANASMVVYTMVEMAKAHGLHPYSYLKYLLDSRPSTDTSDAELANLAPWSEKARIACSNKSE
ncbi:IS66 family transposase [Clostridium sp. AF18-27]|uniref:IS66 family transposase n=1 Tax=Enterocloster lavalensis TaxID=460384 RepID=UPI000E467C08|nr:IS66 family transposase [Enterocloster lavalensis]RHR51878.1 IS66 family transposase [Clostridium sp. AF18-27]